MTDKEQIIIDGVPYYKQRDINKGLDEEHYITEFHLLATHYNLLLEDYASKTAECEELKRKYEWYDHYKDSALLNKKLCDKASDERARYRNALEEIERIALIQKERIEFLSYGYNNDPIMIDILDIISKAKEGECGKINFNGLYQHTPASNDIRLNKFCKNVRC